MNSINHQKTGAEALGDIMLSNAVYAGHHLAGVSVCANRPAQQALTQRKDVTKVDVPTAPAARVKYLKNWAKRQRKTALSTGFVSLLVLPMFAGSAAAQDAAPINASAAEGVVSATIQADGTLLLTMEDGSTKTIAEDNYSVSADGQILIEAEAFAGVEGAFAGGAMAPILGVLAGGAAFAGGGGGDSSAAATTKGFVIDGYISGATVFRDANGNGLLDDGEVSTTTSAQGGFTLGGDQNVSIVSVGGTDISTGLPFIGTLTAPAGSTVVTPVTTMIQKIIEADTTGETTVQEAIAAANAALGLPADTDVLNEDPIASENDGLFAAGAKIANIISVGVAAGADEAAVLEALAKALAEAEDGETPLNDGATLRDVYEEALDGETSNSDIDAVADTVANANNVVDERAAEGDTDGIADVQQVVQGDISDQVKDGDLDDAISADDVEDAADDAEDIVDGKVQFKAAFSEDFDGEIDLAGGSEPQDGAWSVDRFAPEAFEVADLGGESVLRMTIDSVANQAAFQQTQGRKLDLPVGSTEASIKLYIDPSWDPEGSGTGFRQAGFWTTALDSEDESSLSFPIIEFSTLDGVPNFRVYTGVGSGVDAEWIDLGVPTGFEFGTFQELSIAINEDGSVQFTIGDLSLTVDTENGDFDVAALDNVILQGYNQDPDNPDAARPSYDIHWDDLEVTSESGLIDQDTNLAVFALEVDFLSSSYEVLSDVVLTLTPTQADGLEIFGNGTVKLVGMFDADIDLSGISTALDVTEVEGFELTLTAEQADGAEIDLADDSTLTIDVDYADLSSGNPSLGPEIDISGITVNGSSSPADLFQVLDAGSIADTFKLLWSAGDNAYYDAFPGGSADVNGANIELGNIYAQYLLDGGEPLLDIVQTKVGGNPNFEDRQQSLHDNLLGNLSDAAVNSRLNSTPPQLDEDNRDAAGLQFNDRPLNEGNQSNDNDLLATQVWDVANGIPREDFTPGDGEIYVLNGGSVVDADPDAEGIQPFTDLVEASLAGEDGGYFVIGAGTYAGDIDIFGSVTVMGVGDVFIEGGFRVEGGEVSSVVTITGLDLTLGEDTNRVGFYVRGDEVTLNLNDTSVTGTDGVRVLGIETEIGTAPAINVTGSTFTDLTTGIYLNPHATLNVDDTTFTGNVAGIGTDDPAAVTVTDSTFDGNDEAIGFSGDVDNSNVTLSGNQYVQETDQVLLYFAREEPVAISGEWDNVTIVRADQDTITGTDGNDVIVDNAAATVIDLTAGGSDFVVLTANDGSVEEESAFNQILGFSAGSGDGADVLSFRYSDDATGSLRGSTVETLAQGDAVGADTGFIIFTTEVPITSSYTDLRDDVGPTADELTALLAAVDSLEGVEDGSVLMALSNGEDTIVIDVDLDDAVADGDRVVGLAYFENMVASDLTADNLYDFSAVAANT